MPTRRAFTLIELLIALAIVAILAGMAMPVLQLAQRQADRVNTQSMLRKVGTALGLFKGEIGAYPFRAWPVANSDPPDNRLGWHLMHEMSDAERTALRDDMDAAAARYAISATGTFGSCYIGPDASTAQAAYNDYYANGASNSPYWWKPLDCTVFARHLNQVAGRWARSNVLAGNTEIVATKMHAPQGAGRAWIDDSSRPLLPDPGSQGWGGDYLRGELPAGSVSHDGMTLLDRWRRPLVYLCPVQPGEQGFSAETINNQRIEPQWFGFAPRSRRSATAQIASDRRITAPPAMRYSCEVWSMGRDGRFDPLRDAPAGRDDIAGGDYHRGLQ